MAGAGQHAPSRMSSSPLPTLSPLPQTSIIYILATASRSFMHTLNTTEVHGAEQMQLALERPEGQALITVSNHVAAMDDPLVLSTIVPPSYFTRPDQIRWTLCASDRCFKYQALSPLFRAAKVLPIQRGGGLAQPGMQAAEERLGRGEWVHIFPEGTRSQGGGKMGAVRKGIGRLVAACERPPLVVPFVHDGMDDIMPRGKVLPSVGKRVRVLVGRPIPVEDLLLRAKQANWSEGRLHTELAGRVQQHMRALKAQLHGGAPLDASSSSDCEPAVSGLDLYDEADVRWYHRATMWEKVKFRTQVRRGAVKTVHRG
jgi:monolysocardiolipin acyltransferase